jgi:hypothetical protein
VIGWDLFLALAFVLWALGMILLFGPGSDPGSTHVRCVICRKAVEADRVGWRTPVCARCLERSSP